MALGNGLSINQNYGMAVFWSHHDVSVVLSISHIRKTNKWLSDTDWWHLWAMHML